MPVTSHPEFCAFCGFVPKGRRLIAGPGVAICETCVTTAAAILQNATGGVGPDALGPAWEHMSDEEVLSHLPEVSRVGLSVEDQLRTWVGVARERKISWAAIGAALGITRQSAWERFKENL